MAYFDRFDICEAYYAIENDWHVGGVLQERESNQRRSMSTEFQLHRMGFVPSILFRGYKSLTENGKEIYADLAVRYGFIQCQESILNNKEEWEEDWEE